MPVQINELIIKANVVEPAQTNGAGSGAESAGQMNEDKIIKECVAQVLEIIKKTSER